MGTCSEDPHPCWASRLLGLISLFLSVCSSGTNSDGGPGPGAQDSGAPDPLQGIRGGSVLFPLPKKQDAEPEEVTWSFGPASEHRVLLRVRPGEAPIWVSLQDRYQQRVHVPNITSLKIENLTTEDSGLYWARGSFTGGVEFTQLFHLTVYEPIPSPEILAGPRSITPGWCNVTLECGPRGATKDLNVTWKREYIPEELEQTGTLGPASNSHTLAVRLPLSQPYSSITCVVSNQMDQKTATVGLGEVCAHGSQGLPIAGSLGAIVVLLLILGSGLCFWKKCGKKKIEMRRGAGSPEDQKDDDSIQYVELNQQESQEGLYMTPLLLKLPKEDLPDCARVDPYSLCRVAGVCLSENMSPGMGTMWKFCPHHREGLTRGSLWRMLGLYEANAKRTSTTPYKRSGQHFFPTPEGLAD